MTGIGIPCIILTCEKDNTGEHDGQPAGLFARRASWPVLQAAPFKEDWLVAGTMGWEPVCKKHYDQYLAYINQDRTTDDDLPRIMAEMEIRLSVQIQEQTNRVIEAIIEANDLS